MEFADRKRKRPGIADGLGRFRLGHSFGPFAGLFPHTPMALREAKFFSLLA